MLKKLIVTALCASAAFAQTPAIDWDQQKAEILRHYRALVQIDTSNPPGNETQGRRVPEESTRRRRHPHQDLRARSQSRQPGRPAEGQRQQAAAADSGPHRRGRRAAREVAGGPLRRRDEGRLHLGPRHAGRQTDPGGKPHGDAAAETHRRAAGPRRHLPGRIRRGGRPTGVGINFMVAQHFDEIDAEFAITEGGGATIENGRVTTVPDHDHGKDSAPRPPDRERNLRPRLRSAPG